MLLGDEDEVLVPEGRYAQMRNVWAIPSVPALARCSRSRVQRHQLPRYLSNQPQRTAQNRLDDLPLTTDFLDPHDHNKTIEGHQAPVRAVIIAEV